MSGFYCNECNEHHNLSPDPPEEEFIREPLNYQFLLTNGGIFVLTNRKMTDKESKRFESSVNAASHGSFVIVENCEVIDARIFDDHHHHHDDEDE